MDLNELKKSGNIIYKTIVGSHAYGTNVSTSDIDIKGFYWVDPKEYISLNPPVKPQDCQISDEKNDITYYSLYRAFELLKTANPNIIELLWMPNDCILHQDNSIMPVLLENRKIFISKQAYHSHARYAYAQIKKAKGKNKKVHNPMPEKMPSKEDFCWIINDFYGNSIYDSTDDGFLVMNYNHEDFEFPCRPKLIKDTNIDLSKYHVSSMEHSHNVYRLYYYGNEAKGVFRGDDMLACESIPKEDALVKFRGIMIYNKDEYEKTKKEWHSYWSWVKNRNDARWIDQEKGLLNYDSKNMAHCVRLMMSAKAILENGEPIVRFEGSDRDFLMRIRNGELEYEEIMEIVETLNIEMEDLFSKSNLPENCDENKLNDLYKYLMERGL
jgi:uncharacterized protein